MSSNFRSNESDGTGFDSVAVRDRILSNVPPGRRITSIRRSEITHNNNGLANQIRELSEQKNLQDEGIDIDLKSLSLKEAVDELDNRPKNGAIYDEVSAIWTTVNERLKFISNNDGKLSIDEAIEIYDASVLLKLLRKHEDEIESAGQIAHNGVLLMLQGQMLKKKGRQQLALSKSKLQKANL